MEPLELNVSKVGEKETISILWSDGHRSDYYAFSLRSSCPCAMCQGEPGIFGRTYSASKADVRADVVPEAIEPVGKYGLKITWSDGHNLGIYTFDYLRKLCECSECKK
ncbi:MAG TPA: DUF971 domain-containing protein [Nitrososphaerales archaeon]|nr:DUF971 domain-containing protein [Nitrososphaerales archaeon]